MASSVRPLASTSSVAAPASGSRGPAQGVVLVLESNDGHKIGLSGAGKTTLGNMSGDAMSRDEGRRSFPPISFVQVIGRKGDTGKWIEQLTPQLLRIGSCAPW